MRWGIEVIIQMKRKFHTVLPLKMQLQLFADSPAADQPQGDADQGGNADASSTESTGGDSGKAPEGASKKLTFDDVLKTEGFQAEFDRRVSKAIDTALKKHDEKRRILADQKASEAEKLAKMNADEKARYEMDKRTRELDAREAEISRKELKATAKATLADKKIPSSLADLLDYSNAEKCNASIDTMEKAFMEAVETAVKDRLKGSAPIKKAQEDGSKDSMKKTIEEAIKRGLH
jgi:hypothetical protein